MLSWLAPDVDLVVDFRHHWGHFLRFYAERKPLQHKFQPVEKTHLPHHLACMLKLLLQEQERKDEKSDDDTSIGSCMEYLIHHECLDVLSSLCQADTPPGIRPYILNLFLVLLSRIRQPILHYLSVYFPVRRLLMLSATVKASPTETQEMLFIACLVTKLKGDPDLLKIFTDEDEDEVNRRRRHKLISSSSMSSSRRSSAASSTIDLSHIEPIQFESKHLVVSALLNLVDSADYMVAIKAMDSLLVVCSIQEDSAAANAAQGTPLALQTADRLTRLFDSIPPDLEVAMVEEVRVNWAEAHHQLQQQQQDQTFRGKPELVAFFSWLDFCDSLIKSSPVVLAEALARSIRKAFLEGCLERALLAAVQQPDAAVGDSSAVIVRLLALVTQCWTHISSEVLALEFARWLVGEDPERKHRVRDMMLKLCLSDRCDVALEALSLFDVLLDRPCLPILQGLVLGGSLARRGYAVSSAASTSSSATAAVSSWSDEEDARGSEGQGSMAPANIARVINAWLFLAPEDLRSSDSGNEQYVRNAEIQVKATFRSCAGFRWPSEAASCALIARSLSNSEDSGLEHEEEEEEEEDEEHESGDKMSTFYEGAFLETMFDLMETLLKREYEVNLQATSVLAKLARVPHPCLHEFLLNPLVRLKGRTLHGSLRHAVGVARQRLQGVEQLGRKIKVCRRTLLGGRMKLLELNDEEARVIDGLIVLEEFGKEIAAITLVKYHLACGRGRDSL